MTTVATGFGAADITPEKPCELAGYGPDWGRVWTNILDRLKVGVLVIDSGGDRLVIASFDVVALDPSWASRLRAKVAREAGIAADNVLLSAIHTHSGPAPLFLRHWGKEVPETRVRMEKGLFEALGIALAPMLPVTRITVRTARTEGLMFNRDPSADKLPEQERLDPCLRSIVFESTGRSRAITSFGCHPVILGPNLAVSADYPGAFMRELDKAGVDGVFLLGTHGDADPTVQVAKGWGKGTPDDVAETAGRLARYFSGGETREAPLSDFAVAGRTWTVDLPLDVPTKGQLDEVERQSGETLRKAVEAGRARPGDMAPREHAFTADWLADARAALGRGAPRAQRVVIQLLTLGPVKILALPMEVYAGVGHMLREAVADPSLWVVSMANGAVNYLPTKDAYAADAYSSRYATRIYGLFPYSPDVSEVIVRSVRANAFA